MPSEFADVESEYATNKRLKKEDVRILREWAGKQPHLPEISEMKLLLFLHACYYSVEAAKTCVENYYTVRTHCPEFFAKRSVRFEEVQRQLKVNLIALLPKLTSEGYTVSFQKLMDPNPDLFVHSDQIKVIDMATSLYLLRMGTNNAGQAMVCDMSDTVFGHLAKINLTSMRRYLFFLQEALPVRIKAIHIINVSPLTDKLLTLAKPFLKKELIDVLHLHHTLDTLYDYVPKEALPNEYGGEAGTLEELHQQVKDMFMANEKFFEEEERTDVVDETKRRGKPTDVNRIFGMEGTFKQLEID